MTLPSKRKSSDLPQTLTATGTQEKQGEQPREQPRGTGLSTHVTARAYTFPVTSFPSENHMTLPSKRKSSDLPQTLTATGTQEKQGEQPREQPRGTGLSTHVTARAYTFPVTSCKSLDL